jgi:hypothetical protein
VCSLPPSVSPMLRLRHCVECQKCRTRYLVGLGPYANGSCVLRSGHGDSEEFLLYCTCANPAAITRWKWSELKRYSVVLTAYERGYGSAQEVFNRDQPHARRGEAG